MATGIKENRDCFSDILWEVTNIQKARMFKTGHMPCRKKREPVKIRTKPLTGDSTNNEIKKVSVTAVVPVIIKVTTQLGRIYSFLRMPSMA